MARITVGAESRAVYSRYADGIADGTLGDILSMLQSMQEEGLPDSSRISIRQDDEGTTIVTARWSHVEEIEPRLVAAS